MSLETEIFTSEATGTSRAWDPLRVYRRLVHATTGQLEKVVEDARAIGEEDAEGDPEEVLQQKALSRMQADARAFPANEKLLAAISYAFEVEAFDSDSRRGVTEGRRKQLLDDFWEWCKKKETSTGSSSISAASSASPDSSGAAPPPTTSKSGSGCSSTATTTATPPKS